MGWQGASWHHPAQTLAHMQMCTHMCAIYHYTHTPILTVITSCSHSGSHKNITAYEVFGEEDRRGEGGIKVCRQEPKCFSVYLIWALSTCFIRSALSVEIWGPRSKHWFYKCFVLLFVCPQNPWKPQGENKNGRKEEVKRSCFLPLKWEYRKKNISTRSRGCREMTCAV